MNYGEEISYWYFRLNGFFPLVNFVVHRTEETRYSTDIDLLAVRFLKNVERIVKLTLLKNLPLKEVFNLLPEVHSFYELYFAVDRLDIYEIVEFIKK